MTVFFEKRVQVREIVKFFQFEQLTGNEESLNRWVVVPDVNRPGFELSGYFKPTEPRRIVLIGNKEIEYISHLTDAEQRGRYPIITDILTKVMIVTHNNPVPPILLEIAREQNFPIFRTPLGTYRITVDLINFLEEQMAPEDSLSAVLMVVYGRGVLIQGDSGIGKSETALELIKNGHSLVADDRVDVMRIHNTIVGRAPDLLKGMLEIRGIGIIDVERMFGANSLVKQHSVDYVLNLHRYTTHEEFDRLGENVNKRVEILGVQIPMTVLPVSYGRSTRVLVETAVTNFILREEGYDSSEEFRRRLHDYLVEQNAKAKEGKNE